MCRRQRRSTSWVYSPWWVTISIGFGAWIAYLGHQRRGDGHVVLATALGATDLSYRTVLVQDARSSSIEMP